MKDVLQGNCVAAVVAVALSSLYCDTSLSVLPPRQLCSCLQAAPLQRTLGFPFCADLAPLKVDPLESDAARPPRLSWNSGATVTQTFPLALVNTGRTLSLKVAHDSVSWTYLDCCNPFPSRNSMDQQAPRMMLQSTWVQVALAGVFTAAADGHHLLISNTGETVRFTLAAGAQVRLRLASCHAALCGAVALSSLQNAVSTWKLSC